MSALARKYLLDTKSTTDAKSQKCQKCLQVGHWTYECKNERKYVYRPSRTKALKKKEKEAQNKAAVQPDLSFGNGKKQESDNEDKTGGSSTSSSSSSDSSDSDSENSSSSSSSNSSLSSSSSEDSSDDEPKQKRRKKRTESKK